MSVALVVPGDDDDERHDVSYEVELDEPGDGPAELELVDAPDLPAGARLPIIPEHLQTWAGIKAAGRGHRELMLHRAGYHGLRSPERLALMLMWAAVGVFRVIGQQLAWWWVLESAPLRSDAVIAGDDKAWMRLHKEARETRRIRGLILLGEVAALILAGTLVALYVPWWGQVLAVAAVLPLLATAGRPEDRRILSSATVTGRFRRINGDIVLRAYYAAGLGHPEKPDQQVTFGSLMKRDGDGSGVDVDLPYGKHLSDAIEARDKLASGLDVTSSQVFISRDPTSQRRHHLWVADRDPLAVPVGRTPLLACRQTDVWRPAPIGLDERGQLVTVLLLWNAILIGALPRMGKTFVARLLALFAALDPYCKIDAFDASGKPDWRKFALVADSCAFGLTPTRAGLPPEMLLATLERIRHDVEDRYHRLSELEEKHPELCPEGKLTREIARDPRFNMPVRLLVIDEFQEFLTLGDISKEIAALLVYLGKVAPGAGVSVLGATQKPSGIGKGEVGTAFTSFRDNMAVRFSLRTSSYSVSEAVLGQGAYSEGLDSSTLLPSYKGVGILRGANDASPTVRTHLADGPDADKILTAARAIRQRAGTLSGMALGAGLPEAPVSILADVLAVMGDAPGMHWQVLAPLLASKFPDRYPDMNAESVSARVRAAGVDGTDVKSLGRTRNGCRREHVQAALRKADR
jgi:DNA segregation ATPase FtsK/SpoIIIE, S-DNA-T family